MGTGDTDRNDGIDARRELVARLRTHDDVREVNFSRDGFRTVVVELEPGAAFRDAWCRTATRLGYTVERLDVDESSSPPSADVWVLQLDEVGAPTDRPTGGSRLRRGIARLTAFLRRLLER